jgi:hypothetical protein
VILFFWGEGRGLSIYRFFKFLSCWLDSTVSATRLHILFFTEANFQKTEHHLMKLCYVWFQLWLLKPSFGVQNLVGLSLPCIRKNVKKSSIHFIAYLSFTAVCQNGVYDTQTASTAVVEVYWQSSLGLKNLIRENVFINMWFLIEIFDLHFLKKICCVKERKNVIGSQWIAEGYSGT